MPKVVTFRRQPVFTNMKQKVQDDDFNVFHCKRCDTHVVITDVDLSCIPRRKTDSALVLDASKVVIRLNTTKKEGCQLIRREKGVERQYVHECSSCGQTIGYTSKPHEEDISLLYIAETAVKIPWHKKKTPWVCKVCAYVCQSELHLEQHKKQKQHFDDDAAKDDAGDCKPIIVG
eukprot:gnl/TRDRNA2_/TRDRNA2_128797_c0_seq1.p1 gnl/TRDRNA2_/TRDRNA2_128797_c0~~gnl/TRDRNA2_/TRDRNA2_128797_c0_seq1.p1  ORF type:complete len:175 (+),score=29.91 gnl/TRDRNA2_/TRDRNA2_128797_c0_seq1:48-572(+)